MKRSTFPVLFSLAALFFSLNLMPLADALGKNDKKTLKLFDDLQRTIISVSDSIKPSVVHIEVVKKTGQIKYKTLASGLIVHRGGFVLTNEHVVDDAQSITVTSIRRRSSGWTNRLTWP